MEELTLADAADACERDARATRVVDLVPLHAKIGKLTQENNF